MKRFSRRGSMAVEFALFLVVLMPILSATIDYGFYFHRQACMIQATAAATRYISLHPDDESGAIQLGKDSFENATGSTSNFRIQFTGEMPHIYATVTGDSVHQNLVGFVPIPGSNIHTASIRVNVQ